MPTGAITAYIDVAQLALYAFWLFFAGVVLYLLQENKREGYPLISDRSDRVLVQGFPPIPAPKTFLLHDGRTVQAPRREPPETINAVPAARFPGAPYVPVGEPLVSGMGPGAWANRADEPDLTYDDQVPKIVPLRSVPTFFLATEDPDPRGYLVIGTDGVIAGHVVEAWIDRSEVVVRYLEVALRLPDATHHVLLPMNFLTFRHREHIVRTDFLRGQQFALVPVTKDPDTITLLEEDRILGFFGGGVLYATPRRAESLL